MKMYRYIITTLALLLVIAIGASPVAASNQDRAALEASLTETTSHILDTMFGAHQVAAAVTVDLGTESWEVKYTGKANIKGLSAKPKSGSETYKVLPGYNAIKNLSPNEQTQLPFNSEIIKHAAKIKKISIELVADKSVSKSRLGKVKPILISVLGLNEKRGDVVNVSFHKFPIIQKQEDALLDAEIEESAPMRMIDKLMIGVLVLFLLYIFRYGSAQKKLLKAVKAATDALASAGSGGGGGGSRSRSAPVQRAPEGPRMDPGPSAAPARVQASAPPAPPAPRAPVHAEPAPQERSRSREPEAASSTSTSTSTSTGQEPVGPGIEAQALDPLGRWDKAMGILEKQKEFGLITVYQAAKVLSWDNGVVEVGFPAGGLTSEIASDKEKVQRMSEFLSTHAGRPITFKVKTLSEAEEVEARSILEDAKQRAADEKAARLEEAKTHPMTKKVLRTFGAQIKEIKVHG